MKSYDFTADMQAFAQTVGAQTADAGGDYPESPEIGLDEVPKLSWRTDPSVVKVAFWVADAPQHDYRAAQMKQAIIDVHQAGVHIYPVAASGTDDLLELTMRTAALITGGRYRSHPTGGPSSVARRLRIAMAPATESGGEHRSVLRQSRIAPPHRDRGICQRSPRPPLHAGGRST